MLTIAFRWRPGNTEWQYKTVVSKKPPQLWLADRLGAVELGDHPKMDVNILFATEISQDAAEALEKALENQS